MMKKEILNDLKTLERLKDVNLEEDTTTMIEKSDVSPSSFDVNSYNNLGIISKIKNALEKLINSIFPPILLATFCFNLLIIMMMQNIL